MPLRLSAAASPHSRWQADKEPPIDIPQIARANKDGENQDTLRRVFGIREKDKI